MTPVETTLETALPEIEPNRLEPTIAILDEPPRNRPIRPAEISVKNLAPPAGSSRKPKNMKASTMVVETFIGKPNMPLASRTT